MDYNTSQTCIKFLQPNMTFINNITQIQHGCSNCTTIQSLHILCILKEINIYIKKFIFRLITKILNDEDNFITLCNEFHKETPLIVIENRLLALSYII